MAAVASMTRRAFLTGGTLPDPRSSSPTAARLPAVSADCLALQGVTCMVCRDACPEDAIRFHPRLGGLFVPEIDAVACARCGYCLSACPAEALVPGET